MNTLHSVAEAQKKSTVSITVSLRGYEFDTASNKWELDRNNSINLRFLDEFSDEISGSIRDTLIYFAETCSSKHTKNICENLKLYLRHSQEKSFTEFGFVLLKDFLGEKEEYKLSVIRGFLRQMKYLGNADSIHEGVFELINSWKLSGNEKGLPVLSFDPHIGPFSDLEFEAISNVAANSYAQKRLTTERFLTILLFRATGRRPEQLASLKIKDFSYSKKHSSNTMYVVEVPRIKQRKGKFRQSFRPFGLAGYLAQVTEKHIEEQTRKLEGDLGRSITVEELGELPLFLSNTNIKEMQKVPSKDFKELCETELFHMTSASMASRLVSAVNSLGVVSERTGERLHVNAYRFRYTLGTRAAREGAGKITIATLLDQSDAQNAWVYIANPAEYAIEISRIMNQPLSRYASAFAGKVVGDEQEANTHLDGAARIPCREVDSDVGSCGTSSFCQDYAPIACYTCPKFMPWENAPHHLVLKFLMEERERLKKTSATMPVITANDRSILAVIQVITLCEERRQR
ncbi:site-specific integrase [Alteromonas gilva]|uniref:Site-specific integrase n=1 Tax=Alteromonas gilva TaxID=2987522 RepID=A0ABT5KYJ6_9ALTE|nr:site-specific integrase [Alteromonas gilva]MDC8829708.1 site-specific integrase [Alteromonas gilva]